MEEIYIAIVGMNNYFGAKIFKPGQLVKLIKDYDNEYDGEAIMAVMDPVGKVGYVANSPRTVPKGCCSAGRIYDIFGDYAFCVVKFVTKETVIAEFFVDIKIDIKVEVSIEDKKSSEDYIK